VIISAADAAANQTPDGGQVTINTGDGGTGTGTGAGGDFTVICGVGGVGGTSTGLGGAVSISAGRGGVGGTLAHGGAVDITAGDGISTSSDGGHVTITAGDGIRTSGTVFLNAGVTGTPGGVVMVTERSGTGSQAAITMNTQSGFTGQEWEYMTAGVQAATGGPPTAVTVVTIPGPPADGRNVKVRVWGTGETNGVAGNVLSQIIEQSFYRSGGTVLALAVHINNAQTVGTFTGTVALTIVGANIAVQVTADSTTNSNFSLMIEWQDGGLAS
jgi:hypothetical protein